MGTSPKSPDAIDALVGRNIRAQRVARRVSQTTLGQRLGVTFQQVQKYEQGANRVGAGRLIAIARALDVPVMTLLHGAGDGRPGAPPPVELIADRLPLRLVQSFAQISDRAVRRSLVKLVEDIARRDGVCEA